MDKIGKIAIIGAGKMGTAVTVGLLQNGFSEENIKAFEPSEASSARFAEMTGISTISENIAEVITFADIVILAVKPQNVPQALKRAAAHLDGKLLISLAAGIRIKKLAELSGCKRIVRVMPNSPALVCEGMSAFTALDGLDENDIHRTEQILGAIGHFCYVEESLMDAVTGLSGSGPAYVFEFIQAMIDGGVRAGMPRDIAVKLVTQTVIGSARMLEVTGEHPAVLRDRVVSPAGTTANALAVMENCAFRGIVSDAVVAAFERSVELGRE